MAYAFEWDPPKATENLVKHGISFDEAMTVFGDPLAILLAEPSHERSADIDTMQPEYDFSKGVRGG